MRFMKRSVYLIVAVIVFLEIIGYIQTNAKEVSIATPKITVKTTHSSTGVKITISKTKDADAFEVIISGKAVVNTDYRKNYVLINGDWKSADDINITEYIEKDGKTRRSMTINYLPEGSYKVKVRSWNEKKFGTRVYSEYSNEKSFTLKAQPGSGKGYSTSYNFSKVKKGDVIKFGTHEQDLNYANGKEPIEWIVIKKNKKSMLLLSKYAIDLLPYNIEYKDVTWETCTLRKWLNNIFFDSAFNKKEKNMIKSTTIENFDNPEYGTPGGIDTKDKIFLLSQLEMIDSEFGFVEDYNSRDVNRLCVLYYQKNLINYYGEQPTCDWWLRSPGHHTGLAARVNCFSGIVDTFGYSITSNDHGVRPAMWIKIKS